MVVGSTDVVVASTVVVVVGCSVVVAVLVVVASVVLVITTNYTRLVILMASFSQYAFYYPLSAYALAALDRIFFVFFCR